MGTLEPRDTFPPGTLVGERYRIVSSLARGGFGVVYIAEQLATERRVALKVLASHLRGTSVERLLAEARIASRVSSDHIVQVFDAGIDPDSSLVFVAMELLSGMDLAELVSSEGPRSARETVEYLRQTAVGLDKVHRFVGSDGRPAPIVHRDLKPANLFLTQREDGSAWIKILDFGAAKVLSDDSLVSGVLRGTPQFMAFEQAAGEAITPATDIWALGLIAFFLLTARSYWLGAQTESGQAQIFGEVLTLALAPPSQRAHELGAAIALPPAFDAWFLRCVNRNPAERYSSAGEAVRELAMALGETEASVRIAAVNRAWGAHAPRPDVGAPPLATPDLANVAVSSRSARARRSRLTAAAFTAVGVGGAGLAFLWARARPIDAPGVSAADTGATVLSRPSSDFRPSRALPPLASAPPSASVPPSSTLPPANPSPAGSPAPSAAALRRGKGHSVPAAGAASPSAGPSPDVYDLR